MKVFLDGHLKREDKQLCATKWDLFISEDDEDAEVAVRILLRGGSRNPDGDRVIDGVRHLCFHFGKHSDGALSRIWAAFQEIT